MTTVWLAYRRYSAYAPGGDQLIAVCTSQELGWDLCRAWHQQNGYQYEFDAEFDYSVFEVPLADR